ncbi:Homogentisate 1,2-dioxygenase [Vanrija pseudolonga]|uniref:homogentisate 1,2-dioxygenase n=1 Tax=Vanrija pseudolonga TaxID=143232 RepID=A0AAF0Y4H1_9TREE|nr:Homogentisate 1,2-dioxygenase [Vanrija pseudolonga]
MPAAKATDATDLAYLNGFGNHFESEAVPGTLPKLGNAPQRVAHGLYAEQISGTAFTVPRAKNQRSWVYRLRPSVQHSPFRPYASAASTTPRLVSSFHAFSPGIKATPQQLRWDPLSLGEKDEREADFVDGLATLAGAGDSQTKDGLAIHFYGFGRDMGRKSFYNSDGDFLIVPVTGELLITTEFGKLHVPPQHIAVIQRGLKFSVDIVNRERAPGGIARGFICETYKGHFELPDLGPIGANGLANAKDFESPVASYEDTSDDWVVVNKFMGELFAYEQRHSPYDVVAYSGNYVPYRYDLLKFNVIGSISYDHPDPSIFTVLTCPTDSPGTAVCDFVIFAPRWLVAEDTFRPPYFHRNCMAEFMGNIAGTYDAKATGFLPGGASLHNMNSAHGPDADTFNKASAAELRPQKVGDGSMAFMFESAYQLATTKWAIEESDKLQQDYWKVWQGLEKQSDL